MEFNPSDESKMSQSVFRSQEGVEICAAELALKAMANVAKVLGTSGAVVSLVMVGEATAAEVNKGYDRDLRSAKRQVLSYEAGSPQAVGAQIRLQRATKEVAVERGVNPLCAERAARFELIKDFSRRAALAWSNKRPLSDALPSEATVLVEGTGAEETQVQRFTRAARLLPLLLPETVREVQAGETILLELAGNHKALMKELQGRVRELAERWVRVNVTVERGEL